MNKLPTNLEPILDNMATAIKDRLSQRDGGEPLMIGIHSGGVWIARQLHQRLGLQNTLGTLDISFYRDDFTRIGINPEVKPSQLPNNIDDRDIILVDDVLYTGRTIRAALNELFDFGRPASIMLVVLLDRDGRELPIQPDIYGLHIELSQYQHVKLRGPDPLQLEISSNDG